MFFFYNAELCEFCNTKAVLLYWKKGAFDRLSQYVSRVVKYNKKYFQYLTAFFMPTYLTRGLQKFKKFNFHDGFLRADLGRAKNCCQIGWIGCPILQVAQKATMRFQFLGYILLQSP
jgi:hypothetical protein